MTVGDLVRRRDLAWDLALIRARARVEDNDDYDILNGRIFCVERKPRLPRRRERLWQRIFGASRRASHPVKFDTFSLLQLLDQRHNAISYGTRSAGRETVAVPFTHIALLTSANGRSTTGFPADVCREIEEQIETKFDRNIDPSASVRVGSAVTSALSAGEVLAYIGNGVFLPRDGEQPIGRVRVGPSLDTLEEPIILGDRPAGLYRGQSALAFGSSYLITPATARLGLPDEAWFYLEATGTSSNSGQGLTKTIELNARGAHAVKVIASCDRADIRFCFEFAHELPGDYNDTLYVEVTLDERPSRLLHEPPPGRPSFEIAGLRVTDNDLVDGVEAFWFDFDTHGHPVSSAMTPRETTIVHDGRTMRRYSWRRYEYESQPVSDHRIAAERGGFVLRRSDGQPLGFLESPPSPLPAVFQSEWWTTRGYHLDWLDFVGCVENALGSEGLAEIHAGRGNLMMPSIASAPDGEFELGPLILRRTGEVGS